MKKEIEKKKKELEILVKQFNELNKKSQELAQDILKCQGGIETLTELSKKD